MVLTGNRDIRIEPEHLGPLGDRPLAETAARGGPEDLFPGASAFLSARHQRRRREQWRIARPQAERILGPDEQVLYVASAMEVPPTLHVLALGAFAYAYHQVVLVLTETRMIEVLLDFRGKNADSRLRSFPWAGVRELKIGFTGLTLAPGRGRKLRWKVPLAGDRRLLKLLLPRLNPRLLSDGAAAERLPRSHCPKCGAALSPHSLSCAACRATFRSPRLATLLSIAFPGAGLLYAGHPFLALADFFGEAVLYLVFLMMVLEASPKDLAAPLGVGAVLFFITKLHSVHLSRILTERNRPDDDGRRSGFRRFGLAGALASLLIIGSALPLAGVSRRAVDRDLELGKDDPDWTCTRDVREWEAFHDSAFARSQCRHATGFRVTLFAYPQGRLDLASDFRAECRRKLQEQGMNLEKDDEEVPAPFRGFRFVGLSRGENGQAVSVIQYFVLDEENRDIHQVLAAVHEEDGDKADELVRDLLSHARWIDAAPPEHASPEHGT